jgi:predicted RNA-binding Zn-ribbon protein involved in translation (DUF1610 family)
MKREIKCPKCGSTNIYCSDGDDYDFDWYGHGDISQFCWGKCYNCGTRLTWRDSYKYCESYDIQIDD